MAMREIFDVFFFGAVGPPQLDRLERAVGLLSASIDEPPPLEDLGQGANSHLIL